MNFWFGDGLFAEKIGKFVFRSSVGSLFNEFEIYFILHHRITQITSGLDLGGLGSANMTSLTSSLVGTINLDWNGVKTSIYSDMNGSKS